MKQECKDCIYYFGEPDRFGDCRYNPPFRVPIIRIDNEAPEGIYRSSQTEFVRVSSDDWCGKFAHIRDHIPNFNK